MNSAGSWVLMSTKTFLLNHFQNVHSLICDCQSHQVNQIRITTRGANSAPWYGYINRMSLIYQYNENQYQSR